jgi:hypothetical protein
MLSHSAVAKPRGGHGDEISKAMLPHEPINVCAIDVCLFRGGDDVSLVAF